MQIEIVVPVDKPLRFFKYDVTVDSYLRRIVKKKELLLSKITSEKKLVVKNKRSSTEKVGKKHSKELLKLIISTLKKEKAEEIVAIDLNNRTEIADYMVICSGRSTRQVSSIAEKITDSIKKDFRIVSKIEGKTQGDWVLIDSGDIIIHVFRPEVREFYQLEKMWDQNKASVNI